MIQKNQAPSPEGAFIHDVCIPNRQMTERIHVLMRIYCKLQ